ncbi:hypothetical protein SCHPADRAFT_621787 [Schizopora paradoxa]|uniref:Uncharacterized protein n=1 Tax=Schizopora paradoxa TaxID=27342 RepID=A0A0H2R8C4_9AGAM|nr:hypothetical protein SCHPADRAFT_621787 [Schizopora paradoxa]
MKVTTYAYKLIISNFRNEIARIRRASSTLQNARTSRTSDLFDTRSFHWLSRLPQILSWVGIRGTRKG